MAKRSTTQASKAGGRGKSAAKASTSDSPDPYIDAAAAMLALSLDPAWIPTVRANLQTILGQCALVTAFELSDEAEPAPVFKA
jgi:hypothetical protein